MDNIPIYRPWIGEEEAQATRAPLLSGWVTQGPQVAHFEEEFCAYVGAPHAIAVSNCTTALHLALHVLGVGPGDEVITVSHSFIATANSIRYTGARPVFVDIRPDTLNLDPDLVAAAITPRTKAILVVHQIGMPADLRAIRAAAGDLPIVEDAACAVGSEILWEGRWEKIGKPHGELACFSFHPRKLLTTGDGGMITTADPQLAERLRRLRQHAMDVPDTVRHSSRQVIFESYPELGFNYRLTDLQAAVGRVQLGRLPALLERRRAQVARYHERLRGLQTQPEWARSNWQSLSYRLPQGVDQLNFMQHLLEQGIATRRGIMNAHLEPAYADWPVSLPHSEEAQNRCVMLPLFHALTDEQQTRVIAAVEAGSSVLKKS